MHVCCHSSGRSLLFSCLTKGSAPSGVLPTVIPNSRQEPSRPGALPNSSHQTDGSLRLLWALWGFGGLQAKHRLFPFTYSNS